MSEKKNTAEHGIQREAFTLRGRPGSPLVVHAFAILGPVGEPTRAHADRDRVFAHLGLRRVALVVFDRAERGTVVACDRDEDRLAQAHLRG